ncbi:hypothetical protein BLNAU_23784 [Blattamonas nauphoetae]|uniref:Uncharacterized protein n=1 Tax=Blattamonas nauphoetae TaxID=2049346 RepID=A0ABQ9WPP1_9EUKA|nr:hypothetical protein BLNAU_23784 [Blattamonas nauphoetae]
MSTLTIVSSVEGWTMSDDAGDTVSLKCCASSFASLSSVGSVLEKDQQIVAALVNIIPSSENARSPRDPPHMTAEGSRFRVHPNSHLQEVCQNVSFRPIFDVTVTACTYILLNNLRYNFGVLSISHSVRHSSSSLEQQPSQHARHSRNVIGRHTPTLRELGPMMVPPSPPTPVSKLMPQLSFDILGIASETCEPAQPRDADCIDFSDSPLQLVSGACDGSDVAEPADSDEAIESFTLHKTSFNQAVRLTQSAPSVRTAPKVKLPAHWRQCAGTILGAPDDSGIDGSWKPKLSALRTIEQNALRRQGSAGHRSKSSAEPLRSPATSLDRNTPSPNTRAKSDSTSRTACPAAHTHTTLPAALLAPPHPSVGSGLQHRPLSPLVAHTHKPLSPPKDHANLNEPPSPVLCDVLQFSRGNGMRSPQHSKPAPKLVSLPTTLPHPPLFPKIRQCAFCECEEENTDNTSREGKAVAAMKKHHF